MIFIKKILKKNDDKWIIVNRKEIQNLSEDDLRNIIIVTSNKRAFRLKEIIKNE